ncbi:MAG TPA: hypothetical protein VGN63_24095 [Flavisolibacter sp.]|jgi:hypothetical protein|nr:hypothetical protein [Flavisolibacter sp.]
MRAFLICYVLGVLALNFQLDDPIFFYLAMTAFPVTIYLLAFRSKKGKKDKPDKQPVKDKNDPVEIISESSIDLDKSHSPRRDNN